MMATGTMNNYFKDSIIRILEANFFDSMTPVHKGVDLDSL